MKWGGINQFKGCLCPTTCLNHINAGSAVEALFVPWIMGLNGTNCCGRHVSKWSESVMQPAGPPSNTPWVRRRGPGRPSPLRAAWSWSQQEWRLLSVAQLWAIHSKQASASLQSEQVFVVTFKQTWSVCHRLYSPASSVPSVNQLQGWFFWTHLHRRWKLMWAERMVYSHNQDLPVYSDIIFKRCAG